MIGFVLGVMAYRGEGIQDQGGYLQNEPKEAQLERATNKK